MRSRKETKSLVAAAALRGVAVKALSFADKREMAYFLGCPDVLTVLMDTRRTLGRRMFLDILADEREAKKHV